MKYFLLALICTLSLFVMPASAEIGQTTLIDAIATKPDIPEAILLLHQMRPWNNDSIALFNKKVDFYKTVIKTDALVKQQPDLKGKTFRIIVLYEDNPPELVEARFNEIKTLLSNEHITFVWGKESDLKALTTKP